jgi:hypothetical protein
MSNIISYRLDQDEVHDIALKRAADPLEVVNSRFRSVGSMVPAHVLNADHLHAVLLVEPKRSIEPAHAKTETVPPLQGGLAPRRTQRLPRTPKVA